MVERQRCCGLVIEPWTPEGEVGFDSHSGCRVGLLSKIYLPPKNNW